jgi:septal ring factor EnvC (AmiA/AmiB activator)
MSEVNFIGHNERRIRMSQTMMVRNLVALSAITIFLVGLSGCDYWPPALQTQIEQLRSELQSATVEKIQLQNQLASTTKVKDDLQAQVDELARANRDKSSMINSLQNSLSVAQERLAKSAKVATPKTGAAKPSAKVTQKAPAKKKTPAKTTGGR